MLVQTLNAVFWCVFAALGFSELFNLVENLGKRHANKTRQLELFAQEVPLAVTIGALMLLMRVLNIAAQVHIEQYWLLINIQLIFMVYSDLMVQSVWTFLIIKICAAISFAGTGALTLVVGVVFIVTGLGVFLESHYSRSWSPDNPMLFALPPLASAAVFWVLMIVGWHPSMEIIITNSVGFLCAFAAMFITSRTQRADSQIVKRLTHEVQFDALTGARNWAMFQQDFRQAHAAAKADKPLAVLTMDLDHFKAINDQYGHLVGNEALTITAANMEKTLQSIRDDYHLYRTGGEEFAVVLPNTTAVEAEAVAKQCQKTVRAQIIHTDTGPKTLTASFGLTHAQPVDRDATATFKRADHALYASKAAGRDQLTVA